jgi:peptidoglycan lytic transglycosylase
MLNDRKLSRPQLKTILPLLVLALLTACSHKPTRVAVPSAPPPQTNAPAGEPPSEAAKGAVQKTPAPEIEVSADAKPMLVETGIASWYGPPYHNRRGSNGEVYDMHAMTAAHRTLPLGSIVRVVNVGTGDVAIVRITDRGPFVEGRVIDLSKAAAEKIGMLRKGTTQVRLEVLKTPVPIEGGGRWAVQIGGFDHEKAARELAGHLMRRYHSAKVLTFNSPIGDWWVRVRVKDDLRARAEEVLRDTKTSEGATFLVRLD